MIPGIPGSGSGQLPQMLRHFEERGIALLACVHGDDLAGVLLGHVGCLPGMAQFEPQLTCQPGPTRTFVDWLPARLVVPVAVLDPPDIPGHAQETPGGLRSAIFASPCHASSARSVLGQVRPKYLAAFFRLRSIATS